MGNLYYELAISQQTKLLNINHGCVLYDQQPANENELALSCRIDQPHLKQWYMLARTPRYQFLREGKPVCRTCFATLWKKMIIDPPAESRSRVRNAPTTPPIYIFHVIYTSSGRSMCQLGNNQHYDENWFCLLDGDHGLAHPGGCGSNDYH